MAIPTPPIYLDYNATTPHAPEVIEAMRPFFEHEFGNPSSSHYYGEKPRQACQKARQQVARLIGSMPDEIIFTSGGTEANNQAIKAIAGSYYTNGSHIITTQIEHPAILEVCGYMEKHGFSITRLPVSEDGILRVEKVMAAITPATVMISVMHANNEVGTIQPIAEISRRIKGKGILLHTDAAQSVGKIEVLVDDLGVDLLTIAGHKIYAPKGVGALYIRNSVSAEVFCHGAGQEMGRRAGTENVMEIVGLGKACEIAAGCLAANEHHMRYLRDRLESGLLSLIDGIRINGDLKNRLPNTSSVSFFGLEANRILDEIGSEVAVSAGAACHSDHVEISHVLEAMEIPPDWARGTIRFSTGRMTTEKDIDRTIEVVAQAVNTLRRA